MTTRQSITSITCDQCEKDPLRVWYGQHKFNVTASSEERLRLEALNAGWIWDIRWFLWWRRDRIVCPECQK